MIALEELDRPEPLEELDAEPSVDAVPVWVDLEVVVSGTTVEVVLAEVMETPFDTMVVCVTTAWVCDVVPTLV